MIFFRREEEKKFLDTFLLEGEVQREEEESDGMDESLEEIDGRRIDMRESLRDIPADILHQLILVEIDADVR